MSVGVGVSVVSATSVIFSDPDDPLPTGKTIAMKHGSKKGTQKSENGVIKTGKSKSSCLKQQVEMNMPECVRDFTPTECGPPSSHNFPSHTKEHIVYQAMWPPLAKTPCANTEFTFKGAHANASGSQTSNSMFNAQKN